MCRQLDPEEREKVRELIEVRQRNNQAAWKLADYLNDHPCLITRKLMDDVSCHGALPEETTYFALLAGFCELDPEGCETDRRLANDYFRRAVKKLDTKQYSVNPYYRDIHFPSITSGDWQLTYETYQPYEAFIYDNSLLEENYMEIPRVGFFSETFCFPAVLQHDREWMAVKPNEIETMQPVIDAVQGNVVTFGLGLGYFAYMASLKETVNQVTVVEKDDEAIGLFNRFILPQFRYREKIRIIRADAFDYIEKQLPRQSYDFAFVDLWHDVSDGLGLYLKLRKMERFCRQTTFYYWIESALLSGFRWQVFDWIIRQSQSYDEIITGLSNPFLKKLAAQVRLE